MFTLIYWLWREEEFIILALLALMTAIIWKERGETAEQIVGDAVRLETFGLYPAGEKQERGADRAQDHDVSRECACVSRKRDKSAGWQAAMPIQNFIRG